MGRNPWDFLIFGPFQDGDDEESRLDGTAGGRKEVAKRRKKAKDGIEQIQIEPTPTILGALAFLFFRIVSTLSYGLGLDQTMFNIAGMLLPLQIISNGRKRKARNRRKGERTQ